MNVNVELNPNSTITNEIRLGILLGLRREDGTLKAVDVVKSAQAADSPLHNDFEWDDSKAGHKYRIAQAEQMIRTVTVQVKGNDEPVRAFVSLREDRADKSGYRMIVDVLTDSDKTSKLLSETRRDAAALLKKAIGYQKIAGSETEVKRLQRLVTALQSWTAEDKAA